MGDTPASKPEGSAPRPDPMGLAQTQKLAEIGLMTSAVLHEIKQPLAGIKGYAQLLRDQGDPEGRASAILAQVERIEQLVASHRRFLHTTPTRRTRLDLHSVASEAIRLVEPKAHHLGVSISLAPGSAAVHVEGAEGQLLQILTNLLTNAVDASVLRPRRQVEVTVRASPAAEVLVADHGTGIAADAAAKLFTPFFTTKGPEEGTGLGLYISRSLAEANGASLEAVSPAAVGSTARTVFRLRFASPQPATQAAMPRRTAVLVVDDEEVIRDLFRSLLEPEGFEVRLACAGDEAIRIVEQRRFDLVISDKNLPGASGLDVARAVRQRYPDCPVMIMTGYASLETAEEGLSLGLIDYLEKPFDDISEVRGRIRQALAPRPRAEPATPTRRVLVVEDRPSDALRIAEAVTGAGGVPVVATTIAEALVQAAAGRPVGVILSAELKDKALSPSAIRNLGLQASGALVMLCDHPSLEQTIAAIRMGAAACLPRALASPQVLARELARLFKLGKG